MYLTKDGRYLLRGEISDLTTDPLAENIAKMQTANAPVLGDPKAPITLVEYSDFECPGVPQPTRCPARLAAQLPPGEGHLQGFSHRRYPPWRVPPPWPGVALYQQNPKAFWKIYDLLYDNQDLISAATAWDKMLDLAGRAGLNTDTFKSCMASPASRRRSGRQPRQRTVAGRARHANGVRQRTQSGQRRSAYNSAIY